MRSPGDRSPGSRSGKCCPPTSPARPAIAPGQPGAAAAGTHPSSTSPASVLLFRFLPETAEPPTMPTSKSNVLARHSIRPSTTEKRRVPIRRPYVAVRTREYLTGCEVQAILKAAKQAGRYGPRDYALILVAYRHGLRASEVCALEWSQVDLKAGTLAVRRAKDGKPSTHPLRGLEIRAVRPLRALGSCYVFANERGGPLTPASVRRVLESLPGCLSLFIPTCSGTAVASLLQTLGMTPAPSPAISVIVRCSRRCATPNWRRVDSRISGANNGLASRRRLRPARDPARRSAGPRSCSA